MANKNSNLHAAKKAKCDEFYTQLTDIEKELCHYKEQFKDKVVYCNCDDARQSNFFKFFSLNFEHYGLKKLITTSFNANGKGTILIYEGDKNGNRMVDDEEIQVQELNGNGDFRSEECVELLKQADIVVTNPPFSLAREYFKALFDNNVKFLVISPQNAITYKEIFPYIIQGKLWLGHNMVHDFVQPDGNVKKFGNISWFTNMETNKQNYPKCLIKTYNESEYKYYDNYSAINVDKVKDIPYNFEGVIGVPITILNDLCSDGLLHFEVPMRERERENAYRIIGVANHGSDSEYDLFKPTINQNLKFKRILIQQSTESLMPTTATDKENESPQCSSRMRTAQLMETQLTQESLFNVYKIVGATESEGKGFSNGLFDGSKTTQPLVNGNKVYKRIFIQRVN